MQKWVCFHCTYTHTHTRARAVHSCVLYICITSSRLYTYSHVALVAVGFGCQLVGWMPLPLWIILSPVLAVEGIMKTIFLAEAAGVDVVA